MTTLSATPTQKPVRPLSNFKNFVLNPKNDGWIHLISLALVPLARGLCEFGIDILFCVPIAILGCCASLWESWYINKLRS
jgi:hypothetical protein